ENGRLILSLVHNANRERSDVELIEEITPQVAQIPNVEAEFKRGEGGGGGLADISVNVNGPEYSEMIKISEGILKVMRESGNFRSITSSYKSPKEELQFVPDLKKLEQYGINGATIGTAIRTSIYGDDTSLFKEAGEEYDIRVELNQKYKQSQQALDNIS